MQESVIYQDILQTGIQTGIQTGRQEEAVAFASRLVGRRFGKIAPALERQIQKLSREELELLGEALFDFAIVDDLADWLAKRA